jgi:hypothetical protein
VGLNYVEQRSGKESRRNGRETQKKLVNFRNYLETLENKRAVQRNPWPPSPPGPCKRPLSWNRRSTASLPPAERCIALCASGRARWGVGRPSPRQRRLARMCAQAWRRLQACAPLKAVGSRLSRVAHSYIAAGHSNQVDNGGPGGRVTPEGSHGKTRRARTARQVEGKEPGPFHLTDPQDPPSANVKGSLRVVGRVAMMMLQIYWLGVLVAAGGRQ